MCHAWESLGVVNKYRLLSVHAWLTVHVGRECMVHGVGWISFATVVRPCMCGQGDGPEQISTTTSRLALPHLAERLLVQAGARGAGCCLQRAEHMHTPPAGARAGGPRALP